MVSMRRFITLVCVSLTLWCSCERQGSKSGSEAEANGCTLEYQVVLELNKCRTNPSQYAEEVLEPFLNRIQGNLFEIGDEIYRLQEGRPAVEEAIVALKSTEAMGPLAWSDTLYQVADDHCKTQGQTNHVGHTRENGESLGEIFHRFGIGGYGENIDYGFNEAQMIVVLLLVDDGVPSRGHRENILTPHFNRVGVSCGPHKGYQYMCVMDFQYE